MEATSSSTSGNQSSGITGSAKVGKVGISTDHPYLARLDSESIRVFLRAYDAYTRELTARAAQLVREGTLSVEPVRPVGLVYCVNAEQLESAIILKLIPGCIDYKSVTSDAPRAYLDKEVVVTESDLSLMVQKHLRIDMNIMSAHCRMKILFMDYISPHRQQGMAWVTVTNREVAVHHVLSIIEPSQLKTRLEQDISLSKRNLKDNFCGLMEHAIDLSKAFEKLDNGNLHGRQSETGGGSANSGTKKKPDNKPQSNNSKEKSGKKDPPYACLLKSCKGKNRMHWIDDCEYSSAAEKNTFKDRLVAAKAKDGLARSTRSQTSSIGDAASSTSMSVGRLRQDKAKANMDDESPSCIMTVSDSKASVDVTGRRDDGSDEIIASTVLAERAVIKGIGKIEAIDPISLEVALTKKDEQPKLYTFS